MRFGSKNGTMFWCRLSVSFLFTIMDMSGYVKVGIPRTALRHQSEMYTYRLSLSWLGS